MIVLGCLTKGVGYLGLLRDLWQRVCEVNGYGDTLDKYCVWCRVKEGFITKSASGEGL